MDLVNTVRSGGDWGTVAGITWRGGKNAERTRIREVDDIPLPAWDITPLEKYLEAGCSHGVAREPTMPLLATRGCPYSCTFCSNPNMWTTRWTPRDPVKVVDEMAQAVERYQLRNFDLYDLTTIVNRRWTLEFAQEIIDRDLDIKYQLATGTRSEAIDDLVAQKLAESGCTHITVAPESGSEDSLIRTNKKLDLEQFVGSVKSCIKAGMTVSMNLIIFPDDTC
ncbi:MAG TPA: radical SAM protein, partial [Myxococcales bacterium]|nr:radical SAM protein [Myxococcales bacterium]